MSYFIYIIIPLILFIALDFSLRNSEINNKYRVIRSFESVFLIGFVVYLLFITNRHEYITTMISIIPLTLVFSDILANLGATILLFLFPRFKQGDVIASAGFTGTYQSLGFLRTALTASDGALVKIPNNIILNGIIAIKE